MKRKQNNLSQITFDYFPKLEEWPEHYHDFIPALHDYINMNTKIFGMDIETEGLSPYKKDVRIKSISVSPINKIAYSTLVNNADNCVSSMKNFIKLCNDPEVIFIGHNIKFDINWLRSLGIDVRCMLFDTMFAQYLLDENLKPNDLDSAIKRASFYNAEEWDDLAGYKQEVDRENLDKMNRDDLLLYNCRDADASRRLYNYFVPKLKEGGYDKLMATASMVLPILSKMETRGVYLDKEWAYKTQAKIFQELVSLRYSMADVVQVPFNPDSSQSLGQVLYKTLGFTPTKFTKTSAPSTDSEAIGYLYDQAQSSRQNDFLQRILAYKKQMKLLTTYYQPIERWTRYDGRVHATYSLGRFENEEGSGGTVTGRLTCKEPNLQQIPRGKEHRGMFRATDGYCLLDGDFSQLELRVAAFLSQEPVMMEAFLNNLDIHSAVMSDLTGIDYGEIELRKNTDAEIKNRRVAVKRVNFGILYGVQAKRLQRLLRIELGIQQELTYCRDIIKQWLARYTNIARWLSDRKVEAVAQGYVYMPLGQRRRLPDASFDYTKEAAHALSQATNFPIQSLASWICLIGLIILDNYFESHKQWFEGHIIMQVHDSVTAEIKLINRADNLIDLETIKVEVKKIMEVETLNYLRDVFGIIFNVPLVFDIKLCERWE